MYQQNEAMGNIFNPRKAAENRQVISDEHVISNTLLRTTYLII
jgi:hypothetical protein